MVNVLRGGGPRPLEAGRKGVREAGGGAAAHVGEREQGEQVEARREPVVPPDQAHTAKRGARSEVRVKVRHKRTHTPNKTIIERET